MNVQMFPYVTVIIVNYNSGQYALECISSLLLQSDVKLQIIVVDNASPDNSLELFEAHLPETVLLIRSEINLGFGKANNLAAKSAQGDYLLILNPDTRIDDTHAIIKLVDRLNGKPQVGLLAPSVYEPRKDKLVLPRFSYPSSKQLRHPGKLKTLPGEIAWVLGACMLMEREVFLQINGFDEDFFLYGEDVDICLRIRMAGYEIDYAEDISITHVSGASEMAAPSLDKWLRKRRGIFMFYKKHYAVEDQVAIARRLLLRSKCYLFMLLIKTKFFRKVTSADLDKQARLRASTIAAEEFLAKK